MWPINVGMQEIRKVQSQNILPESPTKDNYNSVLQMTKTCMLIKVYLPIPAYLAGDYFLVYLDGLVSKEWRVTSSHLVDQNSQCPPVHSLVVALGNIKLDIMNECRGEYA